MPASGRHDCAQPRHAGNRQRLRFQRRLSRWLESAAIATNASLAIRNEVNDTAVANTFSGQGMLEIENKSGVAIILTGANTYTGATFIASGSLIITSIDDVNPNPIGMLVIIKLPDAMKVAPV